MKRKVQRKISVEDDIKWQYELVNNGLRTFE